MNDPPTVCGIIMPISDTEPYGKGHWLEVKAILDEAVELAGMTPRIVSDSDPQALIHKSIVQNIYKDELILCDVSSRNPNVMLELGMRLAFDKPVVIVKDNISPYPFDATSLQYVEYSSNLRYGSVGSFKQKLGDKLKATLEAARGNRLETFLDAFGQFNLVKIDEREASVEVALLEQMKELRADVRSLRRQTSKGTFLRSKNQQDVDAGNLLLPPGIGPSVANRIRSQLVSEFNGKASFGPVFDIGGRYALHLGYADPEVVAQIVEMSGDIGRGLSDAPSPPNSPRM